MRIINSYSYGIGLRLGTGNNADALIADSDFESNGLRAGCAAIPCTDITVQAPLRVRVTRNRSASSQGFAVFSGHNGAGALTVSQNNVNACLGFAAALGAAELIPALLEYLVTPSYVLGHRKTSSTWLCGLVYE